MLSARLCGERHQVVQQQSYKTVMFRGKRIPVLSQQLSRKRGKSHGVIAAPGRHSQSRVTLTCSYFSHCGSWIPTRSTSQFPWEVLTSRNCTKSRSQDTETAHGITCKRRRMHLILPLTSLRQREPLWASLHLYFSTPLPARALVHKDKKRSCGPPLPLR